ncbi:putative RNA 2'-phosphotransferase [Stackebrandtia endophytica]|uniref:Putative RNA 2'-phosphotransferase n=1 Tax=Stackebrandtia endophytica TaxID=1496996 RepID=A0A543B1A1_9ACTN|nr:putative RNA 2'-phosphotransferase [Stackebrandtia endophytica]
MDVLLTALKARGIRVTAEQLSEVVAANDKRRFVIADGRIRAQQGHSIPIDLGLEPSVPPATLYHGTARKNLDSIFADGLTRGRRHHVHLSADRATALRVGARHGKPTVLTVDTAAMLDAGHRFFQSGNSVWLTDRVPAQYLTVEASA